MRWFSRLEQVLNVAGHSYLTGSACHLDLVQWATDPVWGKIRSATVRAELLEDGLPHLRRQFQAEEFTAVLLNGRSVIDRVHDTGIAALTRVGGISTRSGTYSLYEGDGFGARWLGWSANLQSSFGISSDFVSRVGDWVARQLEVTA